MARDLSSDLRRAGLMAAAIGLAVAGLALVYPWVLDGLLARLEVRGVAVALLAALLVSLPLRRRLLEAAGGLAWIPGSGLAALLAAAALADDPALLRLIPAWVYLCLAGLFAASLRGPDSIVERGARWLVPETPIFVRGYCRTTTALWAAVFLGVAALTTRLALEPDGEAWRRFTSRGVWVAVGGVSLAEFLFRKSWFRYYARGGPFERLWSRLFPAEATERGRRSQAHIDRMHALQGRTGPADRGPRSRRAG